MMCGRGRYAIDRGSIARPGGDERGKVMLRYMPPATTTTGSYATMERHTPKKT